MGNATRTETTVIATPENPFPLESGGSLPCVEIAWQSWGTLDADRSNCVVICHALTGNQRAAGEGGWWEPLIGPGRAVDTDRWFVICTNVLGGRDGSTGPRSINPETGRPYGADFPSITVRDMVRAQILLLDTLGVRRVACVIGGSMGGLQTLEWATLDPERVDAAVVIAAGADHSPWAIAFNAVARGAISLGARLGDTEAGLRLAREIAMISYRSNTSFGERFARERRGDLFAVESWLRHHGERLAERFDAETYTTLTRAMDSHRVGELSHSTGEILACVTARTLAVGISSDVLYPASDVRRLVESIPDARYAEIDSSHGHDAFLIEFDQLDRLLRTFLAASAPTFTLTTLEAAPCL